MDNQFKKEVLQAIGNQIRNLRLERGLTQQELSLRLEIDRTYISRIEKGITNATNPLLYQIAYELGVKPADIFVSIYDDPGE
ncbi:helix-turn-helix domain-containing protein [Halobacillus sp. H74]|uniref:helix-turn-helix domain-containing protein n=1 Tax=Halobacillus sp. H74 TaxID=3457436 RepID=UPI003FCDDE44